MLLRLPTPPKLYDQRHQAQLAHAVETAFTQLGASTSSGSGSGAGSGSGSSSSVPADLTALWTALGVQPTLWLSTRLNTTAPAANLTAWQDVRGSGFGGTAAAPGAGPAFSGTTVSLAGLTADYMALAASTIFDLSGGGTSVLVWAPQTGGANDRIHIGISENSLTRIHAMGAGASGSQAKIGGVARGASTLAYAQSTVTLGTTRRVSIFSKNATTALKLDSPNPIQVTSTTDAAAAGALGFGIGDYFKTTSAGQGAMGFGSLFEIGWFQGVQFTSGQITTTETWAAATPINAVAF